MSRIYRYLSFLVLPAFLFLSGNVIAKDLLTIEDAKACSKQCGEKHGTGMGNDKRKYDATAYESCLSTCNDAQRQVRREAAKQSKRN